MEKGAYVAKSIPNNDFEKQPCALSNGTEIEAKYFIDCGGIAVPLIRMCGCKTAFGGQNDKFGEPSAIKQSGGINGVTYVFRLKKTQDKKHIDDPNTPIDYSLLNPVPVSCFNTYPNGDINVNMLPTMQGDEYFSLGKDADEYGHHLVRNYVNFLAREKGLTGYTLSKIFKAGVREGYTLRGKHVLTENDIRKGVFSQENQTHFIAVGDHMLDVHGAGGLARELDIPYGIPVECCMTNEYENLFAAGTGASFSHIASSTVRLSRTMISLGEGLGEYLSQKVLYKTVDFSKIQESQKFHETTEKWR